MLTGRQVREARALLGMQRFQLAAMAKVATSLIKLAEMTDGECPLTVARTGAIQRSLEAAGIEFIDTENGPGVRLRPDEATCPPLASKA
jgi:type II secretory pathway component PulM